MCMSFDLENITKENPLIDSAVMENDKLRIKLKGESFRDDEDLKLRLAVEASLPYFDGSEFQECEKNISAYSLNKHNVIDDCPNCKNELTQKYCEVVYVVKDNSRVALGPFGFFCSNCPTVLIDESEIKKSIIGNYRYKRPIGIEVQGDLKLFKTWNNKKPMFFIDQIDGGIFDVIDDEQHQAQFLENDNPLYTRDNLEKKRLKKQKKVAKISKRKNRKK